ncbi:hypothetical protein U1Q18_011516 [Sarracenia purpurea var. burkii]
MAAATNHSPRKSGSGDASAAVNNPQSKRGAAARSVASPWTQVVRGAESESIISSSATAVATPSSPSALAAARDHISNSTSDWSPSMAASSSSSLSSTDDSAAEAQPESSDNGTGSINAAKKPAWNKPSNGAVEVGPVMGAVSWPALSESTRASPKSSFSDSLKALPDASVLVSQVITNNTNPSIASNQETLASQKSMKRGGGSSGGSVTANGGVTQPAIPLPLFVETPSDNGGKPGSSVPESSSRDQAHKDSGQRGGFGSQSHSGNDHVQQRNSYRRGNGSPHSRGDGSYHHSYGARRDQDRHDRNSHRSFNGRDAHVQPRVLPRGYVRPPPHEVASPMIYFTAPPPPPPPESLRAVPIVTPIPPPAMFFPPPDPQLHAKLVNQIDYYFSNDNLIKDTFLRRNMDEEGWVPIKLIAGFKKVMLLTNNIQFILDAMRTSDVVEVQNDKVRKRNDWRRWVMPPSVQFPTVSSHHSLGRSHGSLANNIQSLSLDEGTNKQSRADAFLSRSLSGDLNSQFQLPSVVGAVQAAVEASSERSAIARSSTK